VCFKISSHSVGIIGAGGLGASMIFAAENWKWDILGIMMIAIIVMVYLWLRYRVIYEMNLFNI
jgi:ABC-type phosphate/phosphonate transport system permease subunit